MSLFTTHKLLKTSSLLLLGAFNVLGFSPFYFYPASIISLIGLCYFWYVSDSTKQAALAGFAYGLGLFGAGIYWIYISLHTFGGMPSLMAGFSTFALAAFMALFPAAVGALSKRISNNSHEAMIIAIPVFWALSDWVRSWIFTGFPWLTIGYSQVPHSPLAGYMPIIGVYGVTLISVLIASLLAFWFAKKPATMTWQRYSIAALMLIIVSGYLLKQVEWTTPSGKPLSVSLLQGNIAQDMKWDPEIANQTLNQYLTMAESSEAKLIIMPETALPVLSSELPADIGIRLQQHAIKNNGDILLGLVERENGEYFNSVFSLGSSKSAVYRKSHLVPFGEFIPFKMAFGWIYRDLLNMPLSDLSRGDKYQQPMSIAGEKVAVNICYEDVFGEEIIRQLPAATLLVNVSNDAWYGTSYAADQHMQFSQARALETGRMMLRATNTGATAIINHKGYVLAHAPHFTQTSLNGTAQGYTGSTLYVRWGNWPLVLFCFSVIAFVWRRNAMKRIKGTSINSSC
ncbi:MAG: apolipoprotein N-acyltransferase [Methylotenera sp.]|nr:apolipoprotein N-acyltransferase [Methylotenera sp.]